MLFYLESFPLGEFRLFIRLGSPTNIAWVTSDQRVRLTKNNPTHLKLKHPCSGITWIWNVHNVCSQGVHYSYCSGASGSQSFFIFLQTILVSYKIYKCKVDCGRFVHRRNWYRDIRSCQYQRGCFHSWRNSRTISREATLKCRMEIQILCLHVFYHKQIDWSCGSPYVCSVLQDLS